MIKLAAAALLNLKRVASLGRGYVNKNCGEYNGDISTDADCVAFYDEPCR